MDFKKIIKIKIHYLFSFFVFFILIGLFSQIILPCDSLWNNYGSFVAFLFGGWSLIISIFLGEIFEKAEFKKSRTMYFIGTIVIAITYFLVMRYFVQIMS